MMPLKQFRSLVRDMLLFFSGPIVWPSFEFEAARFSVEAEESMSLSNTMDRAGTDCMNCIISES
jgi:hypothetical protein